MSKRVLWLLLLGAGGFLGSRTMEGAPLPEHNSLVAFRQKLMAEISAPPLEPLLAGERLGDEAYDRLKLDKFSDLKPDENDTALRRAVRKARAGLYAISSSTDEAPPELRLLKKAMREELTVNLSKMQLRVRIPAAPMEEAMKAQLEANQREITPILAFLTELHEELVEAGSARPKETKRWRANYDLTLSRVEAQTILVWEYLAALGMMRKELPPFDPKQHTAWLLVRSETIAGDPMARRLNRERRPRLENLSLEYFGTPWEVLANHEKVRPLGLRWQAVP